MGKSVRRDENDMSLPVRCEIRVKGSGEKKNICVTSGVGKGSESWGSGGEDDRNQWWRRLQRR